MPALNRPLCLPSVEKPPVQEPQVKAPAGSSVVRQIQKHYKEIEQQAGVLNEAARLELNLQRDFVISATNLTASVPSVAKYNRLESNMAALLGWKRFIWQSTSDATSAGAVRQTLKERADTAGEIVRLLALNKALPKIRQLQREFLLAVKDNVSATRAQELLYDEVVVGNYPKLLNVSDSALVQERVAAKYLAHKENLLAAGLDDAAQEKLGMLSEEISHAFDEVRYVAGKAGFDIDRLENGGYFPIQATEEFSKFLRANSDTWLEGFQGIKELVQKQRTTNVPIVANLDHMARLLSKQLTGISIPTKSLLELDEITAEQVAKAAKAADEKILEIRKAHPDNTEVADKLIASYIKKQTAEVQSVLQHEQAKMKLLDINNRPNELSNFLSSNFGPDQMKRLFESGHLQQMPATTDELLEFYRGLDLGVRGLADAIVLDPEKAIRGYTDDLYRATVEHSLFKTAFNQGADAGWVVDVVPPGMANSYIRVGASLKLQKWLDSASLADGAADLYIHKTAADQLNGLLEINTSPHHLASLSGAWNSFSSVFRKSLILGGGFSYASRVFLQNSIAHFAATGSLHTLPLSIVDSVRVLGKQFDGLDNLKKLYTIGGKDYTTAELYREVIAQRGGSASSSAYEARNAADNLKDYFPFFNGQGSERARHFNSLYQQRFGNPLTGVAQTAEAVASTARKGFSAAYGVLSFTNQFLDNAFRWASFRELAASGKFNSVEDILRHLDNYYSINGDGGTLGNAIGSIAMPFAAFAINAPGAAVRHALTHPWRATNVMRLYSLAQQDQDLTEAELPRHLRDNESYFATLYKDRTTGERGVIMPGSVDFLLDSYTWMGKLAADLAGANPKSVGNYVEGKLNSEKGLQDTFRALLQKSYVGNIGLSLAGVDPKTLQQYDANAPADTLLGVPISRASRSLLVNLSPILRSLDRNLPTAVVGQAAPARLDALGFKEPSQGIPGLFGAVPTSGGTPAEKPLPLAVKAFSALSGLNVEYIDPQKNILRTYKDFSARQNDIHSTRLQLYKNLTLNDTPKTDPAWKRYEQMKQMEVLLALNKARIDAMALQRGITPPQLTEQLQGKFDSLLTAPLSNDVTFGLIQELANDNPTP